MRKPKKILISRIDAYDVSDHVQVDVYARRGRVLEKAAAFLMPSQSMDGLANRLQAIQDSLDAGDWPPTVPAEVNGG